MSLKVGAKTDVGLVREANEDSYLVDAPLFVVADGMGGHIAGDIASATAIDLISAHSDDARAADPGSLAALIKGANRAILNKAQSDPQLSGMGTTCTLVLFDAERAHIAHVGDSRAYLFRNGELEQLTDDHTLVGRLVREGKLRPEEAAHHPQRSVITRALGVDDDVHVDLSAIDVGEGDRVLICSDGLTSMVEHAQIAEMLETESDPQQAADRLVSLANSAGGEDNITVIVVDVARTDAGANPAQSGAVIAPPREDTPSEAVASVDLPADEPVRRRPIAKIFVATGILAVLALAGYAAVRFALSNSWFVGVNEAGNVAIYQGIPEEIAGLSLKEEHEETAINAADLPEFIRIDIEDGIKVDSREEAETTVRNYERFVQNEAPRPRAGTNDQ